MSAVVAHSQIAPLTIKLTLVHQVASLWVVRNALGITAFSFFQLDSE